MFMLSAHKRFNEHVVIVVYYGHTIALGFDT